MTWEKLFKWHNEKDNWYTIYVMPRWFFNWLRRKAYPTYE